MTRLRIVPVLQSVEVRTVGSVEERTEHYGMLSVYDRVPAEEYEAVDWQEVSDAMRQHGGVGLIAQSDAIGDLDLDD